MQQQLMPTIRRGPGNRKPLGYGQQIVRLPSCPDCDGRGWFLINPFATGGSNGAGGPRNMCQCLTCYDSHEFWKQFGELPPELETKGTK